MEVDVTSYQSVETATNDTVLSKSVGTSATGTDNPQGRTPAGDPDTRGGTIRDRQRLQEARQDGRGCRTPAGMVDDQPRRRRIPRP